MPRKKPSLTFLEAAKAVLEDMKQPMHFKKITEVALQRRLLKSRGKTPEWTMGARLSVDVKEKGIHSEFIRTDNGKYGLRRWKKMPPSRQTPLPAPSVEDKQYWLVSVEPDNFEHDISAGSLDTVGVKYRMRRTLACFKPGDKVVIYIKRKALFAALMEVTGEPYVDHTDRWPKYGSELTSRISVKKLFVLAEDKLLDARPLYGSLDVFTQYPEKHRTLALRNGITQISRKDYEKIQKAMR